MSQTTRLVIGGALAVVAFDALAATATARFGFDYAMAAVGSCLLYLAIGFAVAREGGMRAAVAAGAIAGLADVTLGWAIAWRIGPAQTFDGPLTVSRWAMAAVSVVLLSAVVASIGGLGGQAARARGGPRPGAA